LHIVQRVQRLLLAVFRGGLNLAGAVKARRLEAVCQSLHFLRLLIGQQGIRSLEDAPLLLLQWMLSGQRRQLQVVFEFVALLSLTHSKFNRLRLLLLFGSTVLARDEKVVKRISYLLLLPLILGGARIALVRPCRSCSQDCGLVPVRGCLVRGGHQLGLRRKVCLLRDQGLQRGFNSTRLRRLLLGHAFFTRVQMLLRHQLLRLRLFFCLKLGCLRHSEHGDWLDPMRGLDRRRHCALAAFDRRRFHVDAVSIVDRNSLARLVAHARQLDT